MLYGTILRVPGDFFTAQSHPNVNPPSFVQGLRRLTQAIKPVQASRHLPPQKPFIFSDLQRCSHVFRRIDAIRRPLDPPYSGPHKVIRRIDERNYTIEVNGQPRTVSTDTLKPAYLEAADLPITSNDVAAPQLSQPPTSVTNSPQTQDHSTRPLADASTSQPTPGQTTILPKVKKAISFCLHPADNTAGEVPVAPSTGQSSNQASRRKQQLIPHTD
ncbi:uncharacterized protein LOC111643675 [Copidosoma floridanum]|uniref:uncharacterized protein LOC111643675 n=1 Tax=Copidosoma floridanum TaxID=29053 RepID=UPI000C6F45C8|nr:uncharacterized protein LOC111643675 [Copidosoma floridanum]